MKYAAFLALCFIAFHCYADNDGRENEISFFVLEECVNDVREFIQTFDNLDGFYGKYQKLNYEGLVNNGVVGHAVISSKKEGKSDLAAYVNGALSQCSPNRLKKINLSDDTGLSELSRFLEIRRNLGELDMHITVRKGVMEIAF